MDNARLSARVATSERAAEALQRGLHGVRRLLATLFHGRLRRWVLGHIKPRLARLVELRLVGRSLRLRKLRRHANIIFLQEVVASGDAGALRTCRPGYGNREQSSTCHMQEQQRSAPAQA